MAQTLGLDVIRNKFQNHILMIQDYLSPEATPIAICIESAIMTTSDARGTATKENYDSFDIFE